MESVRVNVILPNKLLKESHELVRKGYFSNFSEVVRDGLRREILTYKSWIGDVTEKDRQLIAWAQNEEKRGRLLSAKDMEKHGLKL
ncbi:MAG: ribbon-helix-helix domain-containing protein [Candidatus Altiarchaeota archaeon]